MHGPKGEVRSHPRRLRRFLFRETNIRQLESIVFKLLSGSRHTQEIDENGKDNSQ